ncbi:MULTISPECIES: hypothetical protein [Priestia]|uniref:hypothetical protein n=1 Tax=Priestia TaxID=2800373 RepID=UPI00300A04B0
MTCIQNISRLQIPTSDFGIANDFYGRILGLKKIRDWGFNRRYQCGNIYIDFILKSNKGFISSKQSIISLSDTHWIFEVGSKEVYESLKWSLIKEDITLYEIYCNVVGQNKLFCKDPDGNTIAIALCEESFREE